MRWFCGFSLFWLVLTLFYLTFAIITFVSSRPIKNGLDLLAKEGPDSVLGPIKGKDISLNETLYRAYKSIIITDIIGFILAAAASITSFLL